MWGMTQTTQSLFTGTEMFMERHDLGLQDLKKFINIDNPKSYELQTSTRTRNKGLAIQARHCNMNTGKSFLSNQAIHHWNNLPSKVLSTNTVNSFKNWIKHYFVASGVNWMLRCFHLPSSTEWLEQIKAPKWAILQWAKRHLDSTSMFLKCIYFCSSLILFLFLLNYSFSSSYLFSYPFHVLLIL